MVVMVKELRILRHAHGSSRVAKNGMNMRSKQLQGEHFIFELGMYGTCVVFIWDRSGD